MCNLHTSDRSEQNRSEQIIPEHNIIWEYTTEHNRTEHDKTMKYTGANATVLKHVLEQYILLCWFTRHEESFWLFCDVYQEVCTVFRHGVLQRRGAVLWDVRKKRLIHQFKYIGRAKTFCSCSWAPVFTESPFSPQPRERRGRKQGLSIFIHLSMFMSRLAEVRKAIVAVEAVSPVHYWQSTENDKGCTCLRHGSACTQPSKTDYSSARQSPLHPLRFLFPSSHIEGFQSSTKITALPA